MDALLTAAASGMRARTEALELLANNLANSNSAGYKADREFHSTYIAAEALDGPEGSLPTSSPLVESNWIDFSQGVSIATGSPLDVALSGRGFFTAKGPNGPLYTRNGSFQAAADGTLQTQNGYAVLGVDNRPIKIQSNAALEILNDGTLRQGGQSIGQLAVVDFDNPQELRKAGSTYFSWDKTDSQPKRIGPALDQGRLESANFQPAESAVRLVNIMRQFETLQRAISMGNELNRHAIEEVAKV